MAIICPRDEQRIWEESLSLRLRSERPEVGSDSGLFLTSEAAENPAKKFRIPVQRQPEVIAQQWSSSTDSGFARLKP